MLKALLVIYTILFTPRISYYKFLHMLTEVHAPDQTIECIAQLVEETVPCFGVLEALLSERRTRITSC